MFNLHVNKNGQRRGCYTWGHDTYLKGEELGFIECIKNKDGDWVAYRKQYQFVSFDPKKKEIIKEDAGNIVENYIDNFYSAQGGAEIIDILNDKNLFTFPKPVKLIKHLLSFLSESNAVVLDFFAGSGTTGQAVLELNKEDGGQRQFILVTLDEKDIPLNVTRERLLRVMTGKTSNNTSDFNWIKNNQPLGDSLDVFKIKRIKNNDLTIFKTIDANDYDPKFVDQDLEAVWKNKHLEEHANKREWICQEFENTCKELDENA